MKTLTIKIISIIVVGCIVIVMPFLLAKAVDVDTGSVLMNWIFGIMILCVLTAVGLIASGICLAFEKLLKKLFESDSEEKTS